MIMCVLLCYSVSIHKSQLLSTGRPISSLILSLILQKLKQKLAFSVQISSHVGSFYYQSSQQPFKMFPLFNNISRLNQNKLSFETHNFGIF